MLGVSGVDHSTVENVDRDEFDTTSDDSEPRPGWATVFVVVAILSIAALPRTIALSGISPILIVFGGILIALWIFARK